LTDGLREAVATYRRVQERLADMRPILRVIAADIRRKIDDSFVEEKEPEGQPWAELSEATLMQRARKARGYRANRLIGPLPQGQSRRRAKTWTRGVAARVQEAVFGAKILQDTSRLRRSITTEVGPQSLSFGTNTVYAAKQHFGDPNNRFGRNRAPVPSRKFLLVSEDGRTLIPEAWWSEQFAKVERWLATGEIR